MDGGALALARAAERAGRPASERASERADAENAEIGMYPAGYSTMERIVSRYLITYFAKLRQRRG